MFVFRREVEPAVLTELQGRLTGLMAEGEYIKLDIIPLGDLWKSTPDAKALCALALFDCLKRKGTLPQSAQTVGQTAVTSAAELVPTAQATAAAADAEAEDDEQGDDEQREAAAQSKTTERASSSLLLAGGCEDAVPPQSASSARSSQSVRAKKTKTPFWCHLVVERIIWSFCQDRLGTNIEETLSKKRAFFSRGRALALAPAA